MVMRYMLRGAREAIRLRRRMRGPILPTWGVDYEAWARFLHHYSKRSTRLPLRLQRQALASMPKAPLPRGVREERVSAGGVPATLFHREGAGDRWLVYLHGGGYSIGSVDTHRDLILRLARAAAAHAFAVDYRLAPEHPFPAALDDASLAWRWLLARGVRPERAVLAGESAGGGLTLATLVGLRDAAQPLPAGAVVLSPWADLTLRGASIDAHARYDYLSRSILETYARRYAPHDPRHPLVSPVFADLRGLPPLLIQAGGAEALLDDALTLAERAEQHGVPTSLRVFPEMIHVFQVLPMLSETQEAVREIGAFAQRVTAPPASRERA